MTGGREKHAFVHADLLKFRVLIYSCHPTLKCRKPTKVIVPTYAIMPLVLNESISLFCTEFTVACGLYRRDWVDKEGQGKRHLRSDLGKEHGPMYSTWFLQYLYQEGLWRCKFSNTCFSCALNWLHVYALDCRQIHQIPRRVDDDNSGLQ